MYRAGLRSSGKSQAREFVARVGHAYSRIFLGQGHRKNLETDNLNANLCCELCGRGITLWTLWHIYFGQRRACAVAAGGDERSALMTRRELKHTGTIASRQSAR